MRRISAYKFRIIEPAEWKIRYDNKAVYHVIVSAEDVQTPDGQMKLFNIRHRFDILDPSYDIIALVGSVKISETQTQSLWFWGDRFWTHAHDKVSVYYRNKCYALYPIFVDRPNELLGYLS